MNVEITRENHANGGEAQALALSEADTLLKSLTKPARQGFHRGRSGNPGGRPKGAYSYRTNPLRGLLSKEGRSVLKAVIVAAKGGDMAAARIVIDRILPRERLIKIALPKVRGAADALQMLGIIVDSVSAGMLTSTEANNLATLARNYIEISASAEVMDRLAALEAKVAAQ